jgi:hypothetical protein
LWLALGVLVGRLVLMAAVKELRATLVVLEVQQLLLTGLIWLAPT